MHQEKVAGQQGKLFQILTTRAGNEYFRKSNENFMNTEYNNCLVAVCQPLIKLLTYLLTYLRKCATNARLSN